MPHQMPTNFPGLIHDVSATIDGGFKFNVVADVFSTISDSLSLIITSLLRVKQTEPSLGPARHPTTDTGRTLRCCYHARLEVSIAA